MAVVDTKREYVGRYNGRLAQQKSGAAFSKKDMFGGGGGGSSIATAMRGVH